MGETEILIEELIKRYLKLICNVEHTDDQWQKWEKLNC